MTFRWTRLLAAGAGAAVALSMLAPAASAMPTGVAALGGVGNTMTVPATTALAAKPAAKKVAATKAAAKKTKVQYKKPFRADGRVTLPQNWKADYVALDRLMCGESIVAKAAGVYSCGGGASYLPACWVRPGGDVGGLRMVVCLRTPTDKKFIAGYVDGKLPATTAGPAWDPWQIVLDSGVKCDFSAGMPWAEPPDGLTATYWCSDDSVLLAPSLGQTFAQDTGMVRMQKKVSPTAKVHQVHAKKVIYAGAAPKVAAAKKGSACVARAELRKALPAGVKLKPGASDGVWCAKKWAYSAVQVGGTMDVGLFKKTAKGWVVKNRGKVCRTPGPVPAALYFACMVN